MLNAQFPITIFRFGLKAPDSPGIFNAEIAEDAEKGKGLLKIPPHPAVFILFWTMPPRPDAHHPQGEKYTMYSHACQTKKPPERTKAQTVFLE